MNKNKFPKPKVITEIPMVVIDGEVYGLEVSELSQEEQDYLKKQKEESKK